MLPVDFPNRNLVYTKPEGWTDDQCMDLCVHKGVQPLEGGSVSPVIISCWQPSKEDIEAINRGEPIYMGVLSAAQPPIWLTTENPFVKEENS